MSGREGLVFDLDGLTPEVFKSVTDLLYSDNYTKFANTDSFKMILSLVRATSFSIGSAVLKAAASTTEDNHEEVAAFIRRSIEYDVMLVIMAGVLLGCNGSKVRISTEEVSGNVTDVGEIPCKEVVH